MKHLWEADHSYYCNLGNYFDNDCGRNFKRFADFLDAFGDADFDMNLLFRWDWKEEDADGKTTFNGDINYRNGELQIFWMGQRKWLYQFSVIEVCRADEPAVIKFLKPRFDHLLEMWEPFLSSQRTSGEG